jgi:hypothetical protein
MLWIFLGLTKNLRLQENEATARAEWGHSAAIICDVRSGPGEGSLAKGRRTLEHC